MSDRFATPAVLRGDVLFAAQGQRCEGYRAASERMLSLAREIDRYLDADSARDETGFGLTVSYWASEQAILARKLLTDHAAIRERGRWFWYEHSAARVARVERGYDGP